MTRLTNPIRVSIAAWLCAGLTLASHVARAQPVSTDNKAAAEALFDEGLSLMQKGDFSAACTKLEQSQSIDHGIGTMLYLAECYEKSGRTASAWALFRQAASEAAAGGETERAEAGKRRAERLTPMLSRLTIQVTAPVTGLELTRNGAGVPSALWGVATPVDPGEHVIEARAAGHEPWSTRVHVGEKAGNAVVVSVPALAPAAPSAIATAPSTPAPIAPSTAATVQAAQAPVDTHARIDDTQAGSTQRTVGLVIGGAGIVAVAVGAVFGLQAISKNDDAEEHCPGGGSRCVDAKGVELTEDAQSAAQLSNVFVIGGAVLAAAGVAVYVLAPRAEQPQIALASDGRSLRATIGGVF